MLVLLRVPEELAEEARTKVVGAITKARAPTVTLFPQERRAIKRLQKYEHITHTSENMQCSKFSKLANTFMVFCVRKALVSISVGLLFRRHLQHSLYH